MDISKVRELHQVSKDTPLVVGGGVNLTNLQGLLSSIGSTNPDYWYGSTLADHIGKIGSVPVRNVFFMFFFFLKCTDYRNSFIYLFTAWQYRRKFDAETCA